MVKFSFFLCADGDDIGRELEKHIFLNDLESLQKFTLDFDRAIFTLRCALENVGGTCIVCSGDSLIFGFDERPDVQNIQCCSDRFYFSIGIGRSLLLAALQMKKAKALGRARICESIHE